MAMLRARPLLRVMHRALTGVAARLPTPRARAGRIAPARCPNRATSRGFTLIELLVVLAILALLLTLATPRYIDHVARARETALRTSLATVRDAIDQFSGEQGHPPASLDELVERRYLRAVPIDPITERRDTWITVTPAELPNAARDAPATGLGDLHSGAPGNGLDGTPYRDW